MIAYANSAKTYRWELDLDFFLAFLEFNDGLHSARFFAFVEWSEAADHSNITA